MRKLIMMRNQDVKSAGLEVRTRSNEERGLWLQPSS